MQRFSDKQKYSDELRSLLLFRPLNNDEIAKFAERSEIISYTENEKIVLEGDVDPSFFIVIRGTVNVTVQQKGSDVFISAIGPGDVFGEAAMFMKLKRTADVIAAEDTVLLRIQRPQMMEFIRDYPRAGNKILMLIIYSLLRKLRAANQELAFERRADIHQDDVDALVAQLAGN
ncbi:cyclic nucleotide-binding domain-containing protein [Marispirochaeta aestuarii]|uniref:cyclic nucleotide-binding domain-containing protein n=1 Tax=Marispirochaeta aestuarii TaxID=1963862 RepID=UPI0029C83AA3|nr:cyclic nucleotide-binding domain-containing protein [Marispirochaeta aestuarii]